MTIFRGKNGQHTDSADASVLQRNDLRRSGKPICARRCHRMPMFMTEPPPSAELVRRLTEVEATLNTP
ncbi:MAG: hypothetical protein PHQ58_21830 [Rhodoferax sp.]|nr:hypothetical protein [Rhodoferax sp.]